MISSTHQAEQAAYFVVSQPNSPLGDPQEATHGHPEPLSSLVASSWIGKRGPFSCRERPFFLALDSRGSRKSRVQSGVQKKTPEL